jgi:hypothetical protein
MLEALCDHLLKKPGLTLHEMELFLLDEFAIVAKSTTSDELRCKVGQIRLHDNKQENKLWIYKMIICT